MEYGRNGGFGLWARSDQSCQWRPAEPSKSNTPLHYYTTLPVVTMRLVLLLWLAVHFLEWMFVQQILFYTAKLLTVVDLNSDVIIQRTDRRSLIEKNIFGLVKDLQTL